jgi:diacylglycerol kinase family enzyme
MVLASVPYGNSNDFIRAFGEKVKEDYRDIRLQLSSPAIKTDIMQCGSVYGLNTCTIGLEAYATHMSINLNEHVRDVETWLPVNLKHALYHFNYFLGGALSATNGILLNQYYKVTVDGEDFSGNYSCINIGNGPCYGGNKMASIHAKPDDGLLDILFFKSASVMKTILISLSYLKGKYYKYPQYISYHRCKEVSVSSETPLLVQIDGEVFVDTSISIKIISGALNFVSAAGQPYQVRQPYAGVPYVARSDGPQVGAG